MRMILSKWNYLHTVLSQAFEDLLITRHVSVIVLRPIYPVLGYIKIHAIVPRLRDVISAIFQRLCLMIRGCLSLQLDVCNTHFQPTFFLCTIIDTASDHVPSAIYIGDVTSPERAGCCQGELIVRAQSIQSSSHNTMRK